MRITKLWILLLLICETFPASQVRAEDRSASFGATEVGFATDAGLWLGTYAMESLWHQPNGVRNFPSESLDLDVRRSTHGGHVNNDYNSREMAWRRYSDTGIAGLVAGAIATPLGQGSHTIASLAKVSRAFAVNNFACTLIKNAVHRSRPKPTLSMSVDQGDDNAKSFPSSHASNAMVAATSIAFLTPDAPIALHAFVYAFGASIGMGRIMADRHFFTDVVAGSAIGVGITRWVFANSDDNHAIFFRGNSIALQIRF